MTMLNPLTAQDQSIAEHATEAVHALLTVIVNQAKTDRYDAETVEHLANACESLSRTALRWREPAEPSLHVERQPGSLST